MGKWMLMALALVGCKAGEDDGTVPVGEIDLDMISLDAVPTPRSEVLTAAHPDTNSIMMFGGNDGPIVNQIPSARFLRETWVFEPGAGWSEVATEGDRPRKRGRYSMSMDHSGNRALLFGGRFRADGQSGDYQLFNDIWAFDFLTRTWSEVHDGSGTAPPPRYYNASGYDEETDTLYVWGGNLNSNPLQFIRGDDLWAFRDGNWFEVETSGDPPSPRVFFGSTFDTSRKQIIVFGGQIGDFQSQAYRDIYGLDVTTGVWERLRGPNGAPSTRMHAHILYDEDADKYRLLGGHTDIGDHNDLWSFDPVERMWTEDHHADDLNQTPLGCLGNGSEVPADYVTQDLTAPERRHRGFYALMHNNLWWAQGIHAECSDRLDDTWRYDLEGQEWFELIAATSGESCARQGDDCECLCL